MKLFEWFPSLRFSFKSDRGFLLGFLAGISSAATWYEANRAGATQPRYYSIFWTWVFVFTIGFYLEDRERKARMSAKEKDGSGAPSRTNL